jgi:hypothetical protein
VAGNQSVLAWGYLLKGTIFLLLKAPEDEGNQIIILGVCLNVMSQDVQKNIKSDLIIRKEYSSPVLTCYGRVEQITLGAGTTITVTDSTYNACSVNEDLNCYS